MLLAEPYMQEALADELAGEGWEVVGEGDTSSILTACTTSLHVPGHG